MKLIKDQRQTMIGLLWIWVIFFIMIWKYGMMVNGRKWHPTRWWIKDYYTWNMFLGFYHGAYPRTIEVVFTIGKINYLYYFFGFYFILFYLFLDFLKKNWIFWITETWWCCDQGGKSLVDGWRCYIDGCGWNASDDGWCFILQMEGAKIWSLMCALRSSSCVT